MNMKKILVIVLSSLFLFSCSKQQKVINSVKDVESSVLGVMTGSTQEQQAQIKFPKAALKRFDENMDAISALQYGQVDAVLTDRPNSISVCKSNPDIKELPELIHIESIAIAIDKSNTELLSKINSIIKGFKSDGTLKEMEQRWFGSSPSFKMADIRTPVAGTPIKIGVTATLDPYCYRNEKQEIIGHDAELAKRISAKIGRPIQFIDMKFTALIIALQSGKIDMILTGMTATEERSRYVNFSEPYVTIPQVMIVKKTAEEMGSSLSNKSFLQKISNSFYNNIILENRYLLIVDGLKTTMIISILATIFGTLLGGLVCLMRMSKNSIMKNIAKVYISILRGTPVLVVLMIIFYIVFASINISPILVAVIAFGLNFAAYVSEMFRTGIEGVDRGQTEAGIALGFTKIQTFINIILPQAIRRIMPVYKGEFISLVKTTSIVGYIAVQDLTKASDIIRSRTFDAFFPLIFVAIIYFLLSWLLMSILGYFEKINDPKVKMVKIRE